MVPHSVNPVLKLRGRRITKSSKLWPQNNKQIKTCFPQVYLPFKPCHIINIPLFLVRGNRNHSLSLRGSLFSFSWDKGIWPPENLYISPGTEQALCQLPHTEGGHDSTSRGRRAPCSGFYGSMLSGTKNET